MYKQAIVIRSDLKMGKGKMAAQAAHASIESAGRADKKIFDEWKKEGQKKVVLKVGSESELIILKEKCKKEKMSCALIHDAGLTQLEPYTTTALGIGPDREEKIDKITGHLKLLG
ncbi:MAG TPA: peptidyl-tRNA hydrolase Pth2 [archaeon]|nr:peptidyl-tRNA hydrolase Pth2 [archaeon]